MTRKLKSVGAKALGLMVVGSLALSSAARAQAPAHQLVLSGYADGVQGENLITGRYELVIEQLASHRGHFEEDEVSASTNLCVAYIMTRHLGAAHAACDEALRDAKLDLSSSTMLSRLAHNEEVALAYSNRAVLKLLQGQPSGAADDMGRARALSQAQYVSQNLSAVMQAAPTVAAATRAGSL